VGTGPVGHNGLVEVAAHIEALDRNGKLLADAADRAGLQAKVPSCPGWQVRDLMRHQGYVHRWATRYVVEQLPEWVPRLTEAEILAGEPPDSELAAWFREGHTALVEALRNADPDLSCYAFLPAPSPRAFWARRQAHETTIHRVDAELAGGEVTPISPELAADGIDELIMGFFGRDAENLSDQQRAGGRTSISVLATDAGDGWLLELTEDGKLAVAVRRGSGDADCTLAGPASGLYRLLWNRADPAGAGVQANGDRAVLAAWHEGMRVTWQ
jgi:uncharacterized protein (TIGR03083 family)